MQALRELWRIAVELWNGNEQITRGFLRIALIIMISWPAVAIIIATVSHEFAFVAIPIWGFALVLAVLIIAYYFPIITSVAAAIAPTRSIMRDIFSLVALELGIGLYFTLTPIDEDRIMIPFLVIVIIMLIMLYLGNPEAKWSGIGKFVCGLIIVILTLIFAFGGREAIKEKAEANYHPPADPAPYPQDYNKKETRRFEYPEPGGGVMVKLQTNCDREDFIAVIPPRHKITLHHMYFGETVKANRCSYDVYGTSFPVYGPPDDWQVKGEFAGDIIAPQFKPLKSLIKFLHPDIRTVYRDLKRNGDEISAENCSDGEIRIYHVYNVSKGILFSGSAQQIGHDGSTVTLEGTITPVKCSVI